MHCGLRRPQVLAVRTANPVIKGGLATGVGASELGPSPFSDGNSPCQNLGGLATGVGCFNGGHRLSAMETFYQHSVLRKQAAEIASMGPSPFSDGNRYVPGTGNVASGPSPFSDGNSNLFRRWCFNGATAFQRWKHLGGLATGVVLQCHRTSDGNFHSDSQTAEKLLQWGHRLSAMETS